MTYQEPKTDWSAEDGVTFDDFNRIEGNVKNIQDQLDLSTVVDVPIIYGMNNVIKNGGKVSVSPKFTIQGKHYHNTLGKDGNCEDISKWSYGSSSLSLDSSNKIFGRNSIKITLTSTSGTLTNLISKYKLDTTKYYLMSAYVKNGNATNVGIKKDNTGGGNIISSNLVTDNTKFNRVGIILQPSDFNVGNYISVLVNGTSTQYAWIDGVMVNEITATEYALGAAALLDKYPYVDSYSCLQNPYIEVKHDNLIRNGNGEEGIGWWKSAVSASTLSVENGKFKIVSTATDFWYQEFKVKPNTNYYITAGLGGTYDNIYIGGILGDGTTPTILSGVGMFNTGTYNAIQVKMRVVGAVTAYFDSIMLIEGTVAPTEYKSCRLESCVFETKLADGDKLTYEDGELTGVKWWKHPGALYGKDYDATFSADYAGFKQITLNNPFSDRLNKGINSNYDGYEIIKYDGKILNKSNAANTSDLAFLGASDWVVLEVADSETGWAESINPNNDEVKAFMNGWKVISNNGTRYTAWVSIVDNSVPGGSVWTTNASAGLLATINVTTNEGTRFASGDVLAIIRNGINIANPTVSSVTSSTITFSSSITFVVGDILEKQDNGSTNISLLNYCKNNVAPNYEGYQLHYKLANPEPITDFNTHTPGDIPRFDVGDNYLYLDSGMVLGEVANPVYYSGLDRYYINSIDKANNVVNPFKYKTDIINSIYRNSIYDLSKWVTQFYDPMIYGNERLFIASSNFDPSATYTVDYKILATQAPQIGTVDCSYTQDIVGAINGIKDELNTKQKHDSALDDTINLSVYEENKRGKNYNFVPWYATANSIFIHYRYYFKVRKKVVPRLTLFNMVIFKGQGTTSSVDVTNKFSIETVTVNVDFVVVRVFTTDAATISDIKAYGVQIDMDLIANCKGVN